MLASLEQGFKGTVRSKERVLYSITGSRYTSLLQPGLHKGPWTDEEDEVVKSTVSYIL